METSNKVATGNFNFFLNYCFSADLYLGNSIVLYSRTLTIFDYGDDFTRNICASWSESTFLLLKPEGVHQTGLVLTQIQDAGFTLARAKLVQMTRHQAEYVYIKFNLDPEFNDLGKVKKTF